MRARILALGLLAIGLTLPARGQGALVKGAAELARSGCNPVVCNLGKLAIDIDTAAEAARITRSTAGNRGGVYFVENESGAIVLKPGANWQQVLSLRIASEMGFGVPAHALTPTDDVLALTALPGGTDLASAIDDAALKATGVLRMEKVDGVALSELTADNAATWLTPERLHDLGELAAFDILSRNLDRFPIWYDRTNAGNVMLRQRGGVAGIDQGFGGGDITDTVLLDAFDRMVSSTGGDGPIARRLREWLTKETGYDVGEAGQRALDEGLTTGVHKIAGYTAADIEAWAADVPGGALTETDAAFYEAVLGFFKQRSTQLASGAPAAEPAFSPELLERLRARREQQMSSRANIEFPKGLEVPGFGSEGRALGGGSSVSYVTPDQQHVIKVYRADSGLARYEVWATRFFEEEGIPVLPVLYHGELSGADKDYYVIVKPYVEGFLLGEMKGAEMKALGLDQSVEITSLRELAGRIHALSGSRFGEFLARQGVDPEIFGYHVNAQFLTTPGDIEGSKLWENFIRTPRGWVLFDP